MGRAPDGRVIFLRGAQPTPESLERLFALHGVRTVVNLRGANPAEAWYRREQAGVEKIGARWVQLRTGGREAPPPELVARFFDLVEDDANWPLFVHCQGGVHRTGLMTALFRMQYQGWSAERAIREMREHGFGWGRTDRSAVLAYLRAYRRDPGRRLPVD